ncbi:hypothetical protein EMCG_08257 [[Emmonsia] crescens]|uniref:Uncharacterized protein n=1 Tax=[Emmonsia] crescens TaxID=73230 RepID=A0A0G2I675_9EURO|nr:hypothetical protein EMCG_08257 [Emmonsia crescens UAMH 3008]
MVAGMNPGKLKTEEFTTSRGRNGKGVAIKGVELGTFKQTYLGWYLNWEDFSPILHRSTELPGARDSMRIIRPRISRKRKHPSHPWKRNQKQLRRCVRRKLIWDEKYYTEVVLSESDAVTNLEDPASKLCCEKLV